MRLNKIESLINRFAILDGAPIDYRTDDSNDALVVSTVNTVTQTYKKGKRVTPEDVYSNLDIATGVQVATALASAASDPFIKQGLDTFNIRGLLLTNPQTAQMFQQIATNAGWDEEVLLTITQLGEHVAKPVIKELGREITTEDVAKCREKIKIDTKMAIVQEMMWEQTNNGTLLISTLESIETLLGGA